jgi:peptide/nickel transport system permease protein
VHRYVLSRLLQMLVTLLAVSLIAFIATSVLGDPSYFVLGDNATPEAVAQYRAANGLDRPAWEQYLTFLGGLVRGDMGQSFHYRAPAAEVVGARLPSTITLGAAALGLAVFVGIPLGTLAALRRGGNTDRVITFVAQVGQAIPGFFLGLLLIIFFAVNLRILPTGGTGDWRHLVLPSVTLGAFLLTLIVRITRSSVIDALGQDYVRTARAKGLREYTTVSRHVMRNVLIAMITVIGLQTSVLFSGAVVTETIFGWPGVGRLVAESVLARDFPVVRAAVMIIASAVVLVNLFVDLLYGFIDPRIKLG